MATRLRPWAIVPVKAVLRTLTALSHGSLPVWAYTGSAARKSSDGVSHRMEGRGRRQRRKRGLFTGGISLLDLPVCSGFVLHVKVGRREAGKSGKEFHPVSQMDTGAMP